jgi:signal transduction histidine kinase
MSRLVRPQWWQRHLEALLTSAPLVVMVAVGYPTRHIAWQWQLLFTALAWLPLTVRNRWPGLMLVIVVAVDAISIGIAGHAHPPTAALPASTMVALYTVGVRWPGRLAWAAAAAAGILQFGVALSTALNAAQDVLFLNWAVVAVAVGQLVQDRRTRLAAADERADEAERSKEAEAQRQVTAERMRIAHDLHDVLAHHITVVNAQAGVAQYLMETDPAAAVKALSGITMNSRAALDELRIALGLLRGESDGPEDPDRLFPAPALEYLDGLLEIFTQAGMLLTVEVRGSPGDLSSTAEIALLRIIQEALTNASKHAPGGSVSLDLDWSSKAIHAKVTNERPIKRGGPKGEGTGHGLIGMRERAAIAGGSVSAGPTPEGGYEVSATLPANVASVEGLMDGKAMPKGSPARSEPAAQ